MHYRELGSTGVRVGEIGMGCNRLGEGGESNKYWVDLVHRAIDLGANLFDTAEAYSWGQSENILGQAVGNRDDVMIASKMSRIRSTNEREFSAARMQETVEGSLRRLKRDCIDIYQLHSPKRQDLEQFDWAEGLSRLKTQGKIRFSGIAVNTPADAAWLMQHYPVDILQITYNVFVTQAEKEIFDLASETGAGLLCRMPLAQGILTGKFPIGQKVSEGHRAGRAGKNLERRIEMAQDLRHIAAAYPGGLTRLALHFSLAHQTVSCIIPGARNKAQLEENISAANDDALCPEVREQIEQIRRKWDRDPINFMLIAKKWFRRLIPS